MYNHKTLEACISIACIIRAYTNLAKFITGVVESFQKLGLIFRTFYGHSVYDTKVFTKYRGKFLVFSVNWASRTLKRPIPFFGFNISITQAESVDTIVSMALKTILGFSAGIFLGTFN